uniref:X8 domain-containing protein n=1 Tax=Nelumbo nucifera TaxID=4432 RepID=A0A822ZKU3_NELNU|nr:TPA_asm: hypothetical protein HUJ06_002285 [Nelumbo nucifera]
MSPRRHCLILCTLLLCFSITATLFTLYARRSRQLLKLEGSAPARPRNPILEAIKKLKLSKHLDYLNEASDPSSSQTYDVGSPFNLPPFDSLAPMPLPENAPPFCVYPPFTPLPPSTIIPTPTIYSQPPPPPPSYMIPIFPIQSPPPGPPATVPIPIPPESQSPPVYVPSPPEYGTTPPSPIYIPSPPSESSPSPPETVPNPPEFGPSPPEYVPSPSIFVPSPTVFLPPVVFPPPSVPPPPSSGGATFPRWCVAKPSVPDPIIQEAMNYACGSGADCESIQPNGSCFHPDTLFAHASYAFNSYWQKTKLAGGTCDFGGTAMLITVDPSFDGCHFLND